jgi:hypothetical protein
MEGPELLNRYRDYIIGWMFEESEFDSLQENDLFLCIANRPVLELTILLSKQFLSGGRPKVAG